MSAPPKSVSSYERYRRAAWPGVNTDSGTSVRGDVALRPVTSGAMLSESGMGRDAAAADASPLQNAAEPGEVVEKCVHVPFRLEQCRACTLEAS